MADYIERAPIMGALTSSEAQAAIRAMTGEEVYAYFLRLINSAQAADVAPVRHGRWEQGDMYDYGDVCSLCDWDSERAPCTLPYCPDCGARMEPTP